MSVAFVVCQLSVVACPLSTVLGFADSEAVGEARAGGGGGGGGATFFLQAPNIRIAPSTKTRVIHFFIGCFTKFLHSSVRPDCGVLFQIHGGAHSQPAAKPFSHN